MASKSVVERSSEISNGPTTERPLPPSQLQEKDAGQTDEAKADMTAINHNTPVQSSECIAHLKFLAAVAQLRESISSSANLFSIDKDLQEAPSLTPEILDRLREKRWQVYVARAAARFTTWWFSLPAYNKRPTVKSIRAMEMKPAKIDRGTALTFTKENVPPLDVLMIWHTFMLNPRCYLEDCLFHGSMNLWATPFPFEVIVDSLLFRDGRFTYEPGLEAEFRWHQQTNRAWDNLGDLSRHRLHCPACETIHRVPWTTARILREAETKKAVASFELATGFADKAFSVKCSGCNNTLTHDKLAVLNFNNDNKALLKKNQAMRGTFLNMDGVMRDRTSIGTKWSNLAPNYFLHACKLDVVKEMEHLGMSCSSMRDISAYLGAQLYKKNYVIKTLGVNTWTSERDMFGTRLGKGRGALRRMMSRYGGWTSWRFSMDLVGAVLRQGLFIHKMQAIDWLQINAAPVTGTDLEGLMLQFVEKYNVFWDIIVRSPGQMAVPTLDVDLVWHTHQLTPQRYYTHSISTTKKKVIRFIDHNDKVEEGRLSDAYEWTVKRYGRITGGKAYSECFCWYCSSARLHASRFPPPPLDTNNKNNVAFLDGKSHTEGDYKNRAAGSHISTHNAVRVEGVAKRVRRNLNRLVKKSQKKDREAPGDTRSKSGVSSRRESEDANNRLAELFQESPPLHLDAHIGNPRCFSVVDGAAGNCISFACANAIGAGSCGGAAFGSACATRKRRYGIGFLYYSRGGGGGGGGGGCGGGGCGGG